LDGRIWVIGFVRVAGQEPGLDDLLYNETSEVRCSGRVFGVPSFPIVTEVLVRYGLGLNALRAGISRSTASAFPNADW
jgi:hypothetical protein